MSGAAVVRIGALERLPKWVICVPLAVQWAWLALRHGGIALPACANPSITAGGLVGETKLEYFRGMGPVARAAVARHCALPPSARGCIADVRSAMTQAGLSYPVVAKPDLGMCGFGVRRIDDDDAMQRYLADFPAQPPLVLQEYLPQDGEAGIFYAPEPGAGRGRVIGLALRRFPQVTGDGVSTVAALVAADARVQRGMRRSDHIASYAPDTVPGAGERVRLATVGSTRVGGLYRDGREYATPQLEAAIDAIARDMPDFFFGRFDVRYESEAQLARGEGLRIMEINGAGSEAIEAWDPDTGLLQAFRIIFAKQRTLFAIAAANRRRGHRPIGVLALLRLHIRQQRLLDIYPPSN